MKKLTTIFLFLLCIKTSVNAQVIKEAVPNWIDLVDYKEAIVDRENVTQGTAVLLFDQQVHVPKQTVYYRLTSEIIDNVGIQNGSDINVAYDPTYQKLKFHTLNIIRDGEIIDKLNISNFQVIRRELNAESYLYDGSLSAVLNLSDVRSGDIIDYSYSIVGFNPIHKNSFSNSFYLDDYDPIGKIHVNILSKNKLTYKSFNTAIEPEISTINGLNKYSWLNSNTKKVEFEDNTPSWKMVYATVLVSDYNSWKEVVDWGLNIYKISNKLNPNLQSKIDEINSKYETEGEKIKATLNFVQDDIRYLGLEYGIGAYKPFSPNKVFEQRFGDCKDKSLLMTTMLNKMNIEAYPMLVNTSLKQVIKEFLPSPKFFDHCVVKVIDGADNEIWYDPTMSDQGGTYNSTFFPNYEYGLVLKEGNDAFDYIQTFADNKVETLDEFTLEEVGKGATLKVTTTYYEYEADNIRSYFKNNSIKAITKDYEDFYSNYFYNVSSLKPPTVEDNSKKNAFTIYEEYKIDSIWRPMTNKEGFIAATFVPTSLSGLLYVPTKKERKGELAVAFPTTKQHNIKIKLPTSWNIQNDNSIVNSSGFYYDWEVNYDKKNNLVEVNHLLKTQKHYITNNEFSEYTKDVNRIDESFGYSLFIQDNSNNSSSNSFGNDNVIVKMIRMFFKVGIWILIVVGIAVFIYVKKKEKEA